MTKINRSITVAVRAVLVFMLSLTQLIIPGLQKVAYFGENKFFDDWSETSVYTDDYAVTLNKTPGKDFVILNLTDLQMNDNELYNDVGSTMSATVDKLIKQVNPDLITVTGDNAWGTFSYIQTANLIDSYEIPWAPVMGNHDGQGCPSEYWCAKVFTNCKNCLFKFGPKDMGYGNYIINIKENGKTVHTVFMMDTHSSIEEDGINGKKDTGYDHFWPGQLKWYEWAVKGIEKNAGKKVQSTVFMHIPLYEYKVAWNMVKDGETGNVDPKYSDIASGVCHEVVSCAPGNNGFFTLAKNLGSTKDFVCGHEHINNFSILYDGIRLTYALKTGKGCYYEEALNGGTKITINSDGETKLEHVYVDYNSLPDYMMPITKRVYIGK